MAQLHTPERGILPSPPVADGAVGVERFVNGWAVRSALQSGLEPTVEPTGFKPVGGSVDLGVPILAGLNFGGHFTGVNHLFADPLSNRM